MNRLLLLLPLLALGACDADARKTLEAAEAQGQPAAARRVEVAVMQPSPATLELSLPGEVEGHRDAKLAAALGGYVEQVAVRRGATVRRGQVLVRVDHALQQAALEQAEAQLAHATSERDRVARLGDHATQAQRDQAEVGYRTATAAVTQARLRRDRALVVAPFDGVVAEVGVEVGEVAQPGAPIVRLVQLDPVKVTLSVADRDVVSLREGASVQVGTAARAGMREGTVSFLGPSADLNTRAFPVEVEVPNPDGALLPGMIARVHLQRVVREDALVLPQDWVVTRLRDQGVFVEEDGVARWRPVTLGEVIRDQVVVESGLVAGDRVVVVGHRELMDGDPLLVARTGTCCVDGRIVRGAR